MKTITDVLYKYLDKKPQKSQRGALIQEVSSVFFSGKDFKKILGQTKEFTIQEIREMYNSAKSWKKNPPALFWKLIREKQEEIKKQKKLCYK